MKIKLIILLSGFIILINLTYAQNHVNNSLFFAVIQDNSKLVDYLLKQRIDVTAKDLNGMTALHFVSNPYIALNLIKNGADVNATNTVGSTPLHWAISKNNDTIARLLLEFGADVNSIDNYGNTPLHLSIHSDDSATLLLVTYNANVNITNKAGLTPIMEVLLQNKNMYSKYLLMTSAEDIKKESDITSSLLETLENPKFITTYTKSTNTNPIITEIFIENYPRAIELIKNKTNINDTDRDGNTALHWAFKKKNRYISKLLLAKKADYNITNNQKQTSIDILLSTRDTNFISYIQNILKDETNFFIIVE